MPLPRQIRELLGNRNIVEQCDNRSLVLDRFANPAATGQDRKVFCDIVARKRPAQYKSALWQKFLIDELKLQPSNVFDGKLQNRMIVNAAGGIMENAGLCLDRFSGLPYIPGSAVKGCARRMAIQDLVDSSADEKSAKLFDLAMIFGWSDQDWSDADTKQGTAVSDFRYACGEDWMVVRNQTKQLIWNYYREHMGLPEEIDERIWRKRLRNVSGAVVFLPAYPKSSPCPDMETDVLTCHHTQYYSYTEEHGEQQYREYALDNENPNPVFFPTITPKHVFTFALIETKRCSADLLEKACRFLKSGLETFGVGAKTAAGYGWFDCGTNLNEEACAEDRLINNREPIAPQSDFNDRIFENAILKVIENKGAWNSLPQQIELLKKPANRVWLEKFLQETADREYKALRAQEWYPQRGQT